MRLSRESSGCDRRIRLALVCATEQSEYVDAPAVSKRGDAIVNQDKADEWGRTLLLRLPGSPNMTGSGNNVVKHLHSPLLAGVVSHARLVIQPPEAVSDLLTWRPRRWDRGFQLVCDTLSEAERPTNVRMSGIRSRIEDQTF